MESALDRRWNSARTERFFMVNCAMKTLDELVILVTRKTAERTI